VICLNDLFMRLRLQCLGHEPHIDTDVVKKLTRKEVHISFEAISFT